MFDPWCPTCEAKVLMGTRRLHALLPVPSGGHLAVLRCHCGTVVSQTLGDSAVLTARSAQAAPSPTRGAA